MAMNKKICRICCDKYQLSDNPIDKCLECEYLFREESYEVDISDVGMIMYLKDKNRMIFDSNDKSYFLKTVKLYEKFGEDIPSDIYNLAIYSHYAGNTLRAIELYDKLLKRNLARKDKRDIYQKKGDALSTINKVKEAKDAYIKSIDYGNKSSYLYRCLGEEYAILQEYGQAIYYHNKALDEYLSFRWQVGGENGDYLYFTSYSSLATIYSELKDYKKAIENANTFLDYYGGFEKIKERYFQKLAIIGDQFIPELIVPMYKLITLSYMSLNDFIKAKDNIKKARIFEEGDTELAK